jgi:hypothetical protein
MPNGIFRLGRILGRIAACDTSGISPSGKCDSRAFAYCMFSAATTNVRIRLRWTRTAGPRACGYPTWRLCWSARLAAIAAPKFGRNWPLPASRKLVRTPARTVIDNASPVIKTGGQSSLTSSSSRSRKRLPRQLCQGVGPIGRTTFKFSDCRDCAALGGRLYLIRAWRVSSKREVAFRPKSAFQRGVPLPKLPIGRRLKIGQQSAMLDKIDFCLTYGRNFHGEGISEEARPDPGETEESCIQGQLGTN